MYGPSWIDDILAVVMIVIGVHCAVRLVVARTTCRPSEPAVDVLHTVMGVAMAIMLIGREIPGLTNLWELAFAGFILWFGAKTVQSALTSPMVFEEVANKAQHLLACIAMLTMYLRGIAMTSFDAMQNSLAVMDRQMVIPGWLLPVSITLSLGLVGLSLWNLRILLVSSPELHPKVIRVQSALPRTHPPVRATRSQVLPTRWTGAIAPRIALCCDIAMGFTMGYVLLWVH